MQSQALLARAGAKAGGCRKLNQAWEDDMAMRTRIVVAALAFGAIAVPVVSEARAVIVEVAPPPPRVEVVPAARVGYVWAPGYWEWRARRHEWHNGYWVRERRGYHWAPHRWVDRGGRWEFENGRWER
jgi:hypothetical protein